MPVNSAAVSATTSERTPMASTSRATSQRYAGRQRHVARDARGEEAEPAVPHGRLAALDRAYSSKRHRVAPARAGQRSSRRRRGTRRARLEGGRGRRVEEVVDAAVAFEHHRLHRHEGAVTAAGDDAVSGLAAGHRPGVALHGAALGEAEGEVADQDRQRAIERPVVARGVGEHPRGRILARELQIGAAVPRQPPAVAGDGELIALRRVEPAVLDAAGRRAAGEEQDGGESPGGPGRAGAPAHPALFRPEWRRSSSENTRRSGMPRPASSTML